MDRRCKCLIGEQTLESTCRFSPQSPDALPGSILSRRGVGQLTARTAFEAENSPGSCCRTAELHRHRDCLASTAFLRWFPEANKQSPSLPSVYGVVFAILVRGAIAQNEIRSGATTYSIADCSIRPSSRRLRTGANRSVLGSVALPAIPFVEKPTNLGAGGAGLLPDNQE